MGWGETCMSEDLDSFVNELQEQIYEETKDAYGEVAFKRWREPLYMGQMPDPDGYARVTGSCGDTMQMFLKFRGDCVRGASFLTDGCGSSTVCGSYAAEMALGKTPDEVACMTGDEILERLGGLPKEDEHCAFLAVETLQEALSDYMKKMTRK